MSSDELRVAVGLVIGHLLKLVSSHKRTDLDCLYSSFALSKVLPKVIDVSRSSMEYCHSGGVAAKRLRQMFYNIQDHQ